MVTSRTLWSLPLLLVALSAASCNGDDTSVATTEGSGTGTGEDGIASLTTTSETGTATASSTGDGDGDGSGDGDGTGGSTTGDAGTGIPCGDKTWQCGDSIDNDGDGKIDLNDPECISPCDDTEGTFATNLPGQNSDCKGDCYWDQDSGVGNDYCEWNLKCDPRNPGAGTMCEYNPNYNMCDLEQTQACIDICAPITPNGCDCFGCCEIQGEFYYLGNGDACTLDNLGGCQTCTFHEGCNNSCEPELCELCFGQTIEDLPPECGEPACPANTPSCETADDCEQGWYCQTGCCYPIELP